MTLLQCVVFVIKDESKVSLTTNGIVVNVLVVGLHRSVWKDLHV